MGGYRGIRRALSSVMAVGLVCGATATSAPATAAGAASPALVALAGSFLGPPGATELGPYRAPSMGIEVVLSPSERTALKAALGALYDPSSPSYHRWLRPGAFDRRYAPTPAQHRAVTAFLGHSRLRVVPSPSPFLVRAVGSSATVAAAFSTTIDTYATASGATFFSVGAPVRLPAALAPDVAGVVGLDDTGAEQPLDETVARRSPGTHYGDAPEGSGLSPSQLDGLYDAGAAVKAGRRGQGRGVTMAVFELAGYSRSDVVTYARQFFGSSYTPPVTTVDVDGGPITPQCPEADVCHHRNDYGGDVEVEADIETQIALAPRAAQFLVYDAPKDKTDETTIDEYLQMASDDRADSISTSWGLCEQDIGAAVAAAESVAFTQMAMQGQSITAAAGDDGAFDCLQDGTSNAHDVAVDDPASQPLVTAVGGTSFESFDPGADAHPSYPPGVETVWNLLDECGPTGQGLVACARNGAGGGGVSVFWPRPAFQKGPGVRPLRNREVPDVSADADDRTPYAEYCLGTPSTNSSCARSGGGWFGVGGTSLSSPLWAAVIGDAIGFDGARWGTATATLYPLFRSSASTYFHDITGVGQVENDNGLYPVTPGYDLATGIGTPDIGALVTETAGAGSVGSVSASRGLSSPPGVVAPPEKFPSGASEGGRGGRL